MRRRPIFLRAFLALAVLWSAVQVLPGGTAAGEVVTVGSAHGERVMLSPAPTTIGARFASLKKASAPDWPSWLFLPSRSTVTRAQSSSARPTLAYPGIRDRESLTFTYDATAPPAASPNPVD